MKHSVFVAISLVFFIASCSTTSEVGDENNARIQFGKSIDGISINDSLAKALKIFGNPDKIGPDIFVYTKGHYNGLEVLFSKTEGSAKKVVQINLKYPYSGTTKDNIGIGSTRRSVESSLDDPEISHKHIDIWYYSGIKWYIVYRAQDAKIQAIIASGLQSK